jgi:hypothetical protein
VLQGQVFTLDDSGQLRVSLASSGWGMPFRILLNGVPIADKGVQDGFMDSMWRCHNWAAPADF